MEGIKLTLLGEFILAINDEYVEIDVLTEESQLIRTEEEHFVYNHKTEKLVRLEEDSYLKLLMKINKVHEF